MRGQRKEVRGRKNNYCISDFFLAPTNFRKPAKFLSSKKGSTVKGDTNRSLVTNIHQRLLFYFSCWHIYRPNIHPHLVGRVFFDIWCCAQLPHVITLAKKCGPLLDLPWRKRCTSIQVSKVCTLMWYKILGVFSPDNYVGIHSNQIRFDAKSSVCSPQNLLGAAVFPTKFVFHWQQFEGKNFKLLHTNISCGVFFSSTQSVVNLWIVQVCPQNIVVG